MTAMLSWLPSPADPLGAKTPTTRNEIRSILMSCPTAALGSPLNRLSTTVWPMTTTLALSVTSEAVNMEPVESW